VPFRISMSVFTTTVCVFMTSKSLIKIMFAIGDGVAGCRTALLQGSAISTLKVLSSTADPARALKTSGYSPAWLASAPETYAVPEVAPILASLTKQGGEPIHVKSTG
jgi:hypothetical protein